MLKIHCVRSAEGRLALETLLSSRGRGVDFATLAEVAPVVEGVARGGVAALLGFVRRFDGVELSEHELFVDPRAGERPGVDPTFCKAFRLAARRIASYHRRQLPRGFSLRDVEGALLAERPEPLASAGVYVPGGRAFYPSSLLMGVVPARVAGVRRIVVATPPKAWRGSPELRWAAAELRVDRVLLAGGAHGIAGLAFVECCAKVVGPGNRFVAAAKHLVSSAVSVDLPAGPSEVLILASAAAPADWIAADLLAQAEHDPDAICLLFTTSARLAADVDAELTRQLPTLPTPETAHAALERGGGAFVFPSLSEAVRVATKVAAEHVQVMGREAELRAKELAATAGAVFVGAGTPTAFGDYVAGPNHVLPTGGAAAAFSGLSVRDFFRWGRTVTFSARAARRLAPAAARLARFEGLEAHARSIELRSR